MTGRHFPFGRKGIAGLLGMRHRKPLRKTVCNQIGVSPRSGSTFLMRLLTRLTAASAITCFGFTLPAPAAETIESPGTAAPAVTVVQVKRTCFVETLQVTGLVAARNEILVRPEKDGLQVEQILVQPGDTVISGQVLARLGQPNSTQDNAKRVAVQAPASGIIYSMAAVVGAMASTGGEPLFRIAQNAEMELIADTPVSTMSRLSPGQSAKIQIIGVGELPGKVTRIANTVNPTTQLGQVHLSIGPDKRVRVGAFGRAIIDTARRCGPAAPLSAILYDNGIAIVQVVRDNRIESRRVTVGFVKDGEAELRDGVSVGDTIVARAGAFVRDGDHVRAVSH